MLPGRAWRAMLLLSMMGMAAPAAHAVYGRVPPSSLDLSSLAIDESVFLGVEIDPGTRLLDQAGVAFSLRELHGKPLLLLFSYYSCDGACPAINRKLAAAIGAVKRFRAGDDFGVLTLSFDRRDSLSSLASFVDKLGLDAGSRSGWRIALFERASDIKRIAHSVGYRWFWSIQDRVFVHPDVLIVLSPQGRVARYLRAGTISPRDVELALIESSGSGPGVARLGDLALGACFSYSYKDGRYVLNLPLFIGAASLVLGVACVFVAFSIFRRARNRGLQSA